ncbi:MAG: hypothetical protein OT477_04525 [Chloroflexi bacterium]|nr:hypothetical protein [Chloroflexota bacterium]
MPIPSLWFRVYPSIYSWLFSLHRLSHKRIAGRMMIQKTTAEERIL